ncbi:protein translocase subunit SecF [bacterium]|nr:MAG: protein translocase subunit SecF [bacterium]QQR62266.1 MAG: protein translocase subunit SecF [bacterium]
MIQFIKYRAVVAFGSFLFLGAFCVMAVRQYLDRGIVFSYSIDFTGGTQVLCKANVPVNVDDLMNALSTNGWLNADVRLFENNEFMVKVQDFSNNPKGLAEKIRTVLEPVVQGPLEILQTEGVGAAVGESLRTKSFKAILISLLAMLLYIAFRFWSVAFALGAVFALLHDSIAMLAMLFFFDKEISMNVIAAILAVLGYSINDTIVIFSRIRQDLARRKNQDLADVVNESINRTLTRTILTSLSTILPVLAMFLFGGKALHTSSFALLVGILFGTYSSIYIASPIMMLFYREPR